MNKNTTTKTILNESDAVDNKGKFILNGKEAMTVHYYKKHILKVPFDRDQNKCDGESIAEFFGTTGYTFWAKAHALNNRWWEKCHVYYRKDLDLFYSGLINKSLNV